MATIRAKVTIDLWSPFGHDSESEFACCVMTRTRPRFQLLVLVHSALIPAIVVSLSAFAVGIPLAESLGFGGCVGTDEALQVAGGLLSEPAYDAAAGAFRFEPPNLTLT